MSSPQDQLQKAIFDALMANTEVMALVDGVHDDVAEGSFKAKKAYISFGASDVSNFGSECVRAGNHTLQLDVWCRKVGARPCKIIVDAVEAALHGLVLALADFPSVELECALRRVFQDADGKTHHGVLQFSVVVEEGSEE